MSESSLLFCSLRQLRDISNETCNSVSSIQRDIKDLISQLQNKNDLDSIKEDIKHINQEIDCEKRLIDKIYKEAIREDNNCFGNILRAIWCLSQTRPNAKLLMKPEIIESLLSILNNGDLTTGFFIPALSILSNLIAVSDIRSSLCDKCLDKLFLVINLVSEELRDSKISDSTGTILSFVMNASLSDELAASLFNNDIPNKILDLIEANSNDTETVDRCMDIINAMFNPSRVALHRFFNHQLFKRAINISEKYAKFMPSHVQLSTSVFTMFPSLIPASSP